MIDGIRQRDTLEEIRKLAKDIRVGLLFVHTLPDLAYRFYSEREKKGLSVFEFLELRSAKVEAEVEGLISLSDAVLYNWNGLTAYRKATRALIHELTNKEK